MAADFIVDGFTYKIDKSQGYAKKAGDWAGGNVESYTQDPLYYRAINTAGVPILLKKTDVTLRKEKA